MSYDVYWVKNRAEKIADFEHPMCWGGKEALLQPNDACLAPLFIAHFFSLSHNFLYISMLLLHS